MKKSLEQIQAENINYFDEMDEEIDPELLDDCEVQGVAIKGVNTLMKDGEIIPADIPIKRSQYARQGYPQYQQQNPGYPYQQMPPQGYPYPPQEYGYNGYPYQQMPQGYPYYQQPAPQYNNQPNNNYSIYESADEVDDLDLRFNNKDAIKEAVDGSVTNDYYNQLKRKQAQINKKAKGPLHMHSVGDIEYEQNMFNHSVDTSKIGAYTSGAGASNGNISGTAAGASVGGGMAESYSNSVDPMFESTLELMGFDLIENSDGSYILSDRCMNSDIECRNKNELYNALKSHIWDTFIIPLQITYGKPYGDIYQ